MEKIEFKGKEIRTAIIGSNIWLSGQDVFNVIGLTWKGASNLKQRGIFGFTTLKHETNGGEQKMTFIDTDSVKTLLLRSRFLTEDESVEFLGCVGIDCNFSKINIKEAVFRKTVKSICDGFYASCFFQFPVGKYKADLFIPIVGFVEYNEPHHRANADKKRLDYIKEYTGKDIYICKQGEEFLFYTRLIKKLMELGVSRTELE